MPTRRSRLPLAALAVVPVLLSGCSDDGDGASSATTVAAEPTEGRDPEAVLAEVTEQPCSVFPAAAARVVAGRPMERDEDLPANMCGYVADEEKSALTRFQPLALGAGFDPLAAFDPTATPLPGLGTDARWNPTALGDGGRLLVRTGGFNFSIETALGEGPETDRTASVRLARGVLRRIGPVRSAPEKEDTPSVCAPLDGPTMEEAVGPGASIAGVPPAGSCLVSAGGPTTVIISLAQADGADTATLDSLAQSTGGDDWPRRIVDAGDAAIWISDPGAPADAPNGVLLMLDGDRVVSLAARSDDADQARTAAALLAVGIAGSP